MVTKKTQKMSAHQDILLLTRAELCSSLNSLNWLVWSPTHYSFFLPRSLVMSTWICCCCLSCWLTHTQPRLLRLKCPSLPLYVAFVWLDLAAAVECDMLLMKNDTFPNVWRKRVINSSRQVRQAILLCAQTINCTFCTYTSFFLHRYRRKKTHSLWLLVVKLSFGLVILFLPPFFARSSWRTLAEHDDDILKKNYILHSVSF